MRGNTKNYGAKSAQISIKGAGANTTKSRLQSANKNTKKSMDTSKQQDDDNVSVAQSEISISVSAVQKNNNNNNLDSSNQPQKFATQKIEAQDEVKNSPYRQENTQQDEDSPNKRTTKQKLSTKMSALNALQGKKRQQPQQDQQNSLQKIGQQQGGEEGGEEGQTEAKGNYFQSENKTTNVRTYLRFRPVNKLEQELSDQGIGTNNVTFPNDKTVKTLNDNNTYNFDKIYKADVQQHLVYKEIFAELLDDALNGYNGTLFAYGPTGSGKTHTMFGPDLENPKLKGIIPRVGDNLFEKIEKETEISYVIKLSMLEIYRENLLDLMNHENQHLKIKESPKRGVQVFGLTWHEINTPQDLLVIIQEGYSSKQTRATKLNEYSSRSHTIVQIDIEAKHQSGAEKAGRLNLIDLAGSEKIQKSGAEGESLEEAKKINLSLSCLGNVINALTTKSSHIPYRDSKLTRILQESLGGNFKTSIIVACSPHSHMQEETTMALRFAARAKQIKLKFSMNIKQSQETLRIMIDQLKGELLATQKELQHYKVVLENTRAELAKQPGSNKEALMAIDQCMTQIQQQIALPQSQSNTNLDEEDQQVALGFLQNNKGHVDKLSQIENKQLKEQISEKAVRIEELEMGALEMKKKILDVQQKVTDIQEEKNQMEVKYSKEKSENQYKEFKIDILNKQLQALVVKVCKNEQDFAQLLKERKELTETKIEDYLKKELKFTEIKLSDYFKNSCNFNFDIEFQKLEEVQKNMRTLTLQECDQNMLKTFAGDIQDLNKTFVMQTQVMPQEMNQSFIGNLDFGQTLTTNQKGLLKTIEFPNQVETLASQGPMSKDLQLILLKQQVVNSHIINQHLVRTINALEWKQVIEYGKYKMNSNLNVILSQHVQILENLLKSSQETHRKLRKRFDQIEFEHNQVRNQLLQNHHQPNQGGVKSSKIQNSQMKRRQSVRIMQQQQKNKSSAQPLPSQPSTIMQQSNQQGGAKDFRWVDDLRKIMDEQGDTEMQLIYNQEGLKKAQDELKKKNELLKKVWEESNVKNLAHNAAVGSAFGIESANNIVSAQDAQISQEQQLMNEEEQREKERLQNKIVSLDHELNTLRAASNQYKKAYVEEKKNRMNTKKLMEELEVALRNNLREENETWQNTIKTIREQYDREIMLRQIESTKQQEKFQGVAYHALNSVQKLKQKQNITQGDIEGLTNEMMRLTDIVNNTQQPATTEGFKSKMGVTVIPNAGKNNGAAQGTFGGVAGAKPGQKRESKRLY